MSLNRFDEHLKFYEQNNEDELTETEVNQWLTSMWKNNGKVDMKSYPKAENYDFNYSLLYEHLSRWPDPPRMIVSDSLPNGRGFYILGDDRKSNSEGNDPDDINSWDEHSVDFYYQRHGRKRKLFYTLVSTCVTLISVPGLYFIRERVVW